MSDRSDLIADAAVTVLSRDGLRGLTHRAVDAEAGLPGGSTSNYFRSRSALLRAVVSRIVELDLEAIADAGPRPEPSSHAPIAEYAARVIHTMSTPTHARGTRARFALSLDEVARPAIEEGHERFVSMLQDYLVEGGHPDPARAARVVTDLLEGALMHAVAFGTRSIDVDDLTDAVQRLLR